MARGQKKTPEQKISDLNAKKKIYQDKIDGYKSKIAELDGQIKDISDLEKEAELDKLRQALADSGKSVEEVLAAIEK